MGTTRSPQRPLRVRAVHVHTASGHPGLTRLIATVATLAISTGTWVIVGPFAGHDLTATVAGTGHAVDLGLVAAVSLVASMVALVTVAAVEQLTRHARGVWTSIAVVTLLLCLALLLGSPGPLTTRMSLAIISLAAGVVLIPGFALSIQSRYEPHYHVEGVSSLPRQR